jgi:tetratricopeptide (TPR) repeat protein
VAAPAHFVGRADELARLDGASAGTVLISAIAGAGGIGKTALALQWAYQNLDRFPDGQLFVDLQGFSPVGSPTDPTTAVRGFLDALGVDPGRIPADPQAQAALYRSLIADKRMLIVLDNAADATQVTPLLPGSPSCTVLVTSRRRLTSLITRYGAHHLPIDVLSDDDARQLLVTRLGAERANAEPEAVDELLSRCGGFALALGIVAGRATMSPAMPLARLVAELALEDEEPTVSLPAVLSWSADALTQEQATAFGLLGIAPGADIGLPAAASLLGMPLARTQRVLGVLEEASLLNVDAHGRYTMHDLIRDHASGQLAASERAAALRRVVDFYLHTAHAADKLFYPHRAPITLDPPSPGTHHHALQDAAAALAWFDSEHANLLAAQQTAVDHGWHQATWQLAWTMNMFHGHQAHDDHQLAVWRTALPVTHLLSDSMANTQIHRFLGRAYANAGHHDEAVKHLHQALVLAEQRGHLNDQAEIYANLAWTWIFKRDYRKALDHGLRSLELVRSVGNPVWEADKLNTVGWCAAGLGDYDLARESCQHALMLHSVHQHDHGAATAHMTLGLVDHQSGQYGEAADHYERAADLYLRIGNARDAASAHNRLGHVYVALGESGQARTAWQQALELFGQQGRDQEADEVRRHLDSL